MDWIMPSSWSDAEGDAEGQGMVAPIEVGIDGAIQIGTVKEESVVIEEGSNVEVPFPPPFVNKTPPLKVSSSRRCKPNKWVVLAITLFVIGIVAEVVVVTSSPTDKPSQENDGKTAVSSL